MSTHRAPLLVLALSLAACGGSAPPSAAIAPSPGAWQRAIVGPGQGYAFGMWRDGQFQTVDVREATGRQTMTAELARERWHMDGSWAVADYQLDDLRGEPVAGVLVRDLRVVDGQGGIADLDEVMAAIDREDDLFLATHVAEARAMLATPRHRPPPVLPGFGTPGDIPPLAPDVPLERSHTPTEIAWSDDELRVVTTAALLATGMTMPCGGAPHPPVEGTIDGVRWTRRYRISARGDFVGMEASQAERLPPEAPCDPRLALAR